MSYYFFHFLAIILFSTTLACSSISTSATTAPVPEPTPKQVVKQAQAVKGEQTAVFAGGCFWGIEAVFEHVKGVTDSRSGYSGGSAKNAKYDLVGGGSTGHAESVQVKFDPSQVSYEQLLKVFFTVHDPTELNRQGPDSGTQYRSAIFYTSEEQKTAAKNYIDELTRNKVFSKSVVTQIVPLEAFYQAEDYHQDYLEHHPDDPYIVYNDIPKVEELKKKFPDLYVEK